MQGLDGGHLVMVGETYIETSEPDGLSCSKKATPAPAMVAGNQNEWRD